MATIINFSVAVTMTRTVDGKVLTNDIALAACETAKSSIKD